jgi:hypothetical protein
MIGGQMSIIGWDDTPSCAITKFDFQKSSLWLRILARVPFFERFAYPVAVKRGLGSIWFPEVSEITYEYFLSLGWRVHQGSPSDLELFLQGSKARLTENPLPFQRPRIAITRLGKELAWTKAIHRANGSLDNLKIGTSPFGGSKN